MRAIAQQHGVDMIVAGTMVRSGGHLRISTQLIDGTSGTLTWSHAADVTLGDLFRLQDSLVEGLVDSLALPLTGAIDVNSIKTSLFRPRDTSTTCVQTNSVKSRRTGRWRAISTGKPSQRTALRAGVGADRTRVPAARQVPP